MSDRPALHVRSVAFRYGSLPVLESCSCSLGAGEFAALAGPNGSGKSTLLSLMAGCLSPREGAVEVLGRPSRSWPPAELARKLAVLPQRDLTPGTLTALEATLLGRSPFLEGFLRFESKTDVAIARDALERIGITHLAAKPLSTLSGGERQLVCLARALAQKPEILLLDEPATGLDLGHQQGLFRLLQSLNRDDGLTVLAVTHDLNLAALYCGRLLLLHEGRIVADGPPAELLRPEVLEPVYGARLWAAKSPDGHPLVGLLP